MTPQRLSGDDLVLTSDKLRGLVDLEVDLRTGVYAVAVNAGMRTYAIPGFGVVDVLSELRAVPGPGGRGHDGDRDGAGLGAAAGQPLPRLGRRAGCRR